MQNYNSLTRGHHAVAGLVILLALVAGVVVVNVRVGKAS
jgi:hypothetical protein